MTATMQARALQKMAGSSGVQQTQLRVTAQVPVTATLAVQGSSVAAVNAVGDPRMLVLATIPTSTDLTVYGRLSLPGRASLLGSGRINITDDFRGASRLILTSRGS